MSAISVLILIMLSGDIRVSSEVVTQAECSKRHTEALSTPPEQVREMGMKDMGHACILIPYDLPRKING